MKSSSVVSFLRNVTVSWEKCSTAMRIERLVMTAGSPPLMSRSLRARPPVIVASKDARANTSKVTGYRPCDRGPAAAARSRGRMLSGLFHRRRPRRQRHPAMMDQIIQPVRRCDQGVGFRCALLAVGGSRQANQASNIEQANYVCNQWGHCWHRPYDSDGYYHPHYWHHWHPYYDGGWGYGGGWHHWHHWQHWHH